MGSFCALHRKAFDPSLLLQQFPAPHTLDTVIHAVRAPRFRAYDSLCVKAVPR